MTAAVTGAGLGQRAAPPTPPRVAFVSTFPPQQCGIATFCQDLRRAVEAAAPLHHPVVAVARPEEETARGLLARIDRDDAESYREAARVLNGSGAEMVCLQHEFGIYGGRSGAMLSAFLDALTLPLVTVLHTVLPDPTADQRASMEALIARSDRLVTMARKGRAILQETYGVEPERVAVIPHGYPERAPKDRDTLKAARGLTGRKVLLTFGLLSPGKGLETAIDALPAVAERCPEAVYVVAGATHPGVVARDGEAYREGLRAQAERLGVSANLRFVDKYLSLDELLDLLQLADVYVTPYLSERQITSGTLTYAFGVGLPIVSTPYWHAAELLADDHGRLVPFGEAGAMADAVSDLFADDEARAALSARVRAAARGMSWPAVGERFASLFAQVAAGRRAPDRKVLPVDFRRTASPRHSYGHLLRMTDGVGIAQHAVFKVPDRGHGYCIDDCARVLIACAEEAGRPGAPEGLRAAVSACAAFVEHAWNPEAGLFRNFMSYDRRWLERAGSDDSNGRALWALGWTSARAADRSVADWAEHLYLRTRDLRGRLRSPRSLAFCVLAEAARRERRTPEGGEVFDRYGALMALQWDVVAEGVGRPHGWRWFETSLAYDNARLCEALIEAGRARGREDWTRTGLDALSWLWTVHDRGDHLNMVGTENFGRDFARDALADEQPIEAAALVDACAAAYRATGDARWRRAATDAFAWFGGRNRLGVSLVDPGDGACADGLHEDRPNANHGAESVLAYAQAAATMASLTEAGRDARGEKASAGR